MDKARGNRSGLVERVLRANPRLASLAGGLERFIPLPYNLRENLRQWLLRAVHEPDFRLFDRLHDQPGLMLDVGANRGHAAIAVLRRTRLFRVVSLEPNPSMRWSLGMVRLLHPRRFRFYLQGASHRSGRMDLIIPTNAKNLSSQASFDPREFEKAYVRQRLASQGHPGGKENFKRRAVNVLKADELGLSPDVVKIDVEGWEAQVLQGMEEILKRCKPLLIIELNNRERWAPALARQGYLFYTLDKGCLLHHARWEDVPGLNVICLHPDAHSPVTRHLLPR